MEGKKPGTPNTSGCSSLASTPASKRIAQVKVSIGENSVIQEFDSRLSGSESSSSSLSATPASSQNSTPISLRVSQGIRKENTFTEDGFSAVDPEKKGRREPRPLIKISDIRGDRSQSPKVKEVKADVPQSLADKTKQAELSFLCDEETSPRLPDDKGKCPVASVIWIGQEKEANQGKAQTVHQDLPPSSSQKPSESEAQILVKANFAKAKRDAVCINLQPSSQSEDQCLVEQVEGCIKKIREKLFSENTQLSPDKRAALEESLSNFEAALEYMQKASASINASELLNREALEEMLSEMLLRFEDMETGINKADGSLGRIVRTDNETESALGLFLKNLYAVSGRRAINVLSTTYFRGLVTYLTANGLNGLPREEREIASMVLSSLAFLNPIALSTMGVVLDFKNGKVTGKSLACKIGNALAGVTAGSLAYGAGVFEKAAPTLVGINTYCLSRDVLGYLFPLTDNNPPEPAIKAVGITAFCYMFIEFGVSMLMSRLAPLSGQSAAHEPYLRVFLHHFLWAILNFGGETGDEVISRYTQHWYNESAPGEGEEKLQIEAPPVENPSWGGLGERLGSLCAGRSAAFTILATFVLILSLHIEEFSPLERELIESAFVGVSLFFLSFWVVANSAKGEGIIP